MQEVRISKKSNPFVRRTHSANQEMIERFVEIVKRVDADNENPVIGLDDLRANKQIDIQMMLDWFAAHGEYTFINGFGSTKSVANGRSVEKTSYSIFDGAAGVMSTVTLRFDADFPMYERWLRTQEEAVLFLIALFETGEHNKPTETIKEMKDEYFDSLGAAAIDAVVRAKDTADAVLETETAKKIISGVTDAANAAKSTAKKVARFGKAFYEASKAFREANKED